jgi:hypothetical protein
VDLFSTEKSLNPLYVCYIAEKSTTLNGISNQDDYAKERKLTVLGDTNGSIVQLGNPVLLKLSGDGSWVQHKNSPAK